MSPVGGLLRTSTLRFLASSCHHSARFIHTLSRPLPLLQSQINLPSLQILQTRSIKESIKSKIDFSCYPKLEEKDLEEDFVHGSGPGGQKVNKAHNCVQLLHKPTGLRVKCHISRDLQKNRKVARELLLEKLDEHINGENSVKSQLERIERERARKENTKRAKWRELKKFYKEKETTEQGSTEEDNSSNARRDNQEPESIGQNSKTSTNPVN